nr:hypothetical protein [Tomitella gaofuii]
MSIRQLVHVLRPLQEITVMIAGHEHTAADPISPEAAEILHKLQIPADTPGH